VGSLAWLVTAAPGCSLLIDLPPTGPENRCTVETDCHGGRCDVELGMCVTDAPKAYSYVLQVRIPASDVEARPALTAVAGMFIASSGDAVNEVPLRAPVPVEGWVRTRGPTGEESVPVAADIVFTPRADRFGLVLPSITVRTHEVASTGDLQRRNDFVTALVPGLTYDVEVRPRGDDRARYYPMRAQFELRGPQRFDVEVPDAEVPNTAIELGGVVVDSEENPQGGLEIRAIEDETGRLVSSVATTDSSGEFSLRIDPSARPWKLRISAPAALAEHAAFPTIVVSPSVLVNENGRGQPPWVRILVPSAHQGVCFAGTVEFPPEFGMRPVVGAILTLRSTQIVDRATGIEGSYTVQLVSQAGSGGSHSSSPLGCSGAPLPPGGFEGRLLPGDYELEIQAPEPELGVFFLDRIEIRRDTLGHVFRLPARSVLTGIVRRSSEEPVMDARVRAIPVGVPLFGVADPAASTRNRPSEAVTDARGQFALPLDVGLYDLIVVPPPSSRFPWLVRSGYGIGGSREPLWEVLDVRMPVAVRGVARFEDGSPVARAELGAYALVSSGEVERAIAIGEARTDEAGAFVLLLLPEIRF